MTRWWSYAAVARESFLTEIARPRPADLTERVRLLEARLRETQPSHLSVEEQDALQGLLRTVHRLTLTARG